MRLSDDGGSEQESVFYFSCENTTQWSSCSAIGDITLPVLAVPHLPLLPICCINRHYSHFTLSHSCGTSQLKCELQNFVMLINASFHPFSTGSSCLALEKKG